MFSPFVCAIGNMQLWKGTYLNILVWCAPAHVMPMSQGATCDVGKALCNTIVAISACKPDGLQAGFNSPHVPGGIEGVALKLEHSEFWKGTKPPCKIGAGVGSPQIGSLVGRLVQARRLAALYLGDTDQHGRYLLPVPKALRLPKHSAQGMFGSLAEADDDNVDQLLGLDGIDCGLKHVSFAFLFAGF